MLKRSQTYHLLHSADINWARLRAARFAAELGFDRAACDDVASAVSLLAHNSIEYAGCGRLSLSEVSAKDTVGIEIVSEDDGPGFSDLEQDAARGAANAEGLLATGRLGLTNGLGGVRRFADELVLENPPHGGARCRARKWRRRARV